jgi:hypothetical protein
VSRFSLNFCLEHLSFQEKFSEVSQKYIGLHVKYQVLLSDVKETWIFWTYFRKIILYQITWKSVQCGTRATARGRMDRWADTAKQLVTLHNFTNAPKSTRVLTALQSARSTTWKIWNLHQCSLHIKQFYSNLCICGGRGGYLNWHF